MTVADALPAGTQRRALFRGGFSCLYDPRHARIGKALTRAKYFAHKHVIVSYNGDLRGVIEDVFGLTRDVRVSVPTFHSIGALVQGSALLATVPTIVARQIALRRPKLRTIALPFPIPETPMELLWRSAIDDDEALRFVMARVERVARARAARYADG